MTGRRPLQVQSSIIPGTPCAYSSRSLRFLHFPHNYPSRPPLLTLTSLPKLSPIPTKSTPSPLNHKVVRCRHRSCSPLLCIPNQPSWRETWTDRTWKGRQVQLLMELGVELHFQKARTTAGGVHLADWKRQNWKKHPHKQAQLHQSSVLLYRRSMKNPDLNSGNRLRLLSSRRKRLRLLQVCWSALLHPFGLL